MTNIYEMQLYDLGTGRALPFSGAAFITSNGSYDKLALYDGDDVLYSASNSMQFSNGMLRFRTAESVSSVDIYGTTQYGYTFQLKNVKPGAVNAIRIDLNRYLNLLVCPFSYVDAGAAAAEFDTGLDLAKDVPVISQGAGCFVAAIDATETIDVGTDSTSGANDPNGFFEALSVGVLGHTNPLVGYVIGSNSVYADLTGGTGEWTMGALFHPASTRVANAEGTDSATTKNGFYILKPHIPGIGGATSAYTESLTYTLSSGADTAKGLIVLPQLVNNVPSF